MQNLCGIVMSVQVPLCILPLTANVLDKHDDLVWYSSLVNLFDKLIKLSVQPAILIVIYALNEHGDLDQDDP